MTCVNSIKILQKDIQQKMGGDFQLSNQFSVEHKESMYS